MSTSSSGLIGFDYMKTTNDIAPHWDALANVINLWVPPPSFMPGLMRNV